MQLLNVILKHGNSFFFSDFFECADWGLNQIEVVDFFTEAVTKCLQFIVDNVFAIGSPEQIRYTLTEDGNSSVFQKRMK